MTTTTRPRTTADGEIFPDTANVPHKANGSHATVPAASSASPSIPSPSPSPVIGRNAVVAVQDVPTLQWANGKPISRPGGSASNGRFLSFVGFHMEAGKDEELDAAMKAAKMTQVEIKHQRTGGAEIVRHWALPATLAFFPVTSGPVAGSITSSLAGRNAAATADAGLGLRWGKGEKSKMAVRGYLDTLVKVGYTRLVQLSVRSRMTDVLLDALLQHGAACEAADSLVDRTKHPEVVTYHELALVLGAGEEQEWGKGDTSTVVPFVCLHPEQIDREYLRTIWRPDAVHAAAQQDWESIVQWAQDYAMEAEASDD